MNLRPAVEEDGAGVFPAVAAYSAPAEEGGTDSGAAYGDEDRQALAGDAGVGAGPEGGWLGSLDQPCLTRCRRSAPGCPDLGRDPDPQRPAIAQHPCSASR